MKPALPIVVIVAVDGVAVATIDPATWDDGTAVDDPQSLATALAATAADAIADTITDTIAKQDRAAR